MGTEMNIDMTRYGLTARFKALALEYKDLMLARVISQEKSLYRIITEKGEFCADVSGKFRYEADLASDFPAVGDFVMVDIGEYEGNAVIQKVLDRKSCFVRKAAGESRQEQVVATNIDTLFLCMALNNDFNLRRLERYLSIAWDSSAIPVIILTKGDLCGDIAEKITQTENAALGVDIIVTNIFENDSHKKLLPYVTEGKTAAFIGSSGVGKSTLINRLIGEEYLETGEIRDDGRGRHTTTRRELIPLANGGCVIDTPGMRELGMWDNADGIDKTFADIEEIALYCKFRDCTHTNEKGCAVLEAVENGTLSRERLLSYKKLNSETEYAADSKSYLLNKEKKFKEIAKQNKSNRKR